MDVKDGRPDLDSFQMKALGPNWRHTRQLNHFILESKMFIHLLLIQTKKMFLIWKEEIPLSGSEKSDLDGSTNWHWRTWGLLATFSSTLRTQTWLCISPAYCKRQSHTSVYDGIWSLCLAALNSRWSEPLAALGNLRCHRIWSSKLSSVNRALGHTIKRGKHYPLCSALEQFLHHFLNVQ